MDAHPPDESTNLLGAVTPPDRPTSPAPAKPQHVWRTILYAAAVILVLNMSNFVSLAAQTTILQDIVCEDYYRQVQPDHHHVYHGDRCKDDAVQREMAYINAWKDVFEIIPSLCLAIPYGILADRIGRKKVLILAIVGCFLNDVWVRIVYWFHDVFPVRAVWLGGLWQLIGGGSITLSSVPAVMVADICPPDQRTTAFSQLPSAHLIAQFLFVPIGGALVSVHPWISMWISTVFMVLGLIGACIVLPETLPAAAKDHVASARSSSPIVSAQGQSVSLAFVQRRRRDIINLGRWTLENWRIVLVLLGFVTFYIGQQAGGTLLLQYALSGWATILLSLDAGVNLLVHALLIPALSSFLLWRMDQHEIVKDKYIAQISGIFLTCGSLVTFLALSWPAMVAGQFLYSLGLAFTVPARSVVTSLVAQEHLAALYTGISVLAYVGMLAGGPLFASTFDWGMHLGDFWMGMPFMVAGAFFVVATCAVSAAPLKSAEYDRLVTEREES